MVVTGTTGYNPMVSSVEQNYTDMRYGSGIYTGIHTLYHCLTQIIISALATNMALELGEASDINQPSLNATCKEL